MSLIDYLSSFSRVSIDVTGFKLTLKMSNVRNFDSRGKRKSKNVISVRLFLDLQQMVRGVPETKSEIKPIFVRAY